MRRRELLLGAAGLALAAPATASSAPTEGAVALDLMAHEQRAKLAYQAAMKAGRDSLYATIHQHESDHADALATELAAIGLGRPLPPRLTGRSAAFAQEPTRENAIELEDVLVSAYIQALPQLPDSKLAQVAATILASHAQHRLILGSAAS
jgi:Ferritin-like domain